MSELLSKHGIEPSQENLTTLSERYYQLLPRELEQREGRVLPGARELLDQLALRSECEIAVLTGNMPTSARLKLENYNLWSYFKFGVYGDLAKTRPGLATPALSIVSSQSRHAVDVQQIVIVGDTPLDVELAKIMGCRCLAVGTGGFTEKDLHGACKIVSDLRETASILDWCFNKTPTQENVPSGVSNGR